MCVYMYVRVYTLLRFYLCRKWLLVSFALCFFINRVMYVFICICCQKCSTILLFLILKHENSNRIHKNDLFYSSSIHLIDQMHPLCVAFAFCNILHFRYFNKNKNSTTVVAMQKNVLKSNGGKNNSSNQNKSKYI